jgi:hypothetical protein
MEEVCSSETSVNYQISWQHIPEDSHSGGYVGNKAMYQAQLACYILITCLAYPSSLEDGGKTFFRNVG